MSVYKEDYFDLIYDYYIDLQLFESPEDEGRTEDPTARKRKKAREEGNVAKSQDLSSAMVFLFSFWAIWGMASITIATIKTFMVSSYKSLNSTVSLNSMPSYILSFSLDYWRIIGPALLVAVVIGFLGNVFQVGFMFTPKAISPKFNKIAFTFKKLKEKILFSKQMMFNLLFSLSKFIALSVIFAIIIWQDIDRILVMSSMPLPQSLGIIGSLALKLFNAAGLFLIAIGIPDYFVKKKQHEDSLKMKKEEVKKEMKEDEGDPLVKGQIKEMYQKLLNTQNIRKRVPEADVVITNPTHFAIALKYDEFSMSAPMVIAKGEDNDALIIRELAKENEVPIVENKELARQLYALSEIGDYIPEEFFLTVAEILIQTGKFGQQNIA